MGKHGNVLREQVAPGKLKELFTLGAQAMPSSLSLKEIDLLLGEKKGLAAKAIRAAVFRVLGSQNPFQFAIPLDCLEDIMGWRKLQRDLFGAETDFIFRMPRKRKGAGQLVVRFPGITALAIWEKCQETFPCGLGHGMGGEKWTEVSLEDLTSARTAEAGAYGVWLIDRMPYEELEAFKKPFASTVRDDKNSEESLLGGITLEERLLYELKYYREYGHHASMEDSMNVCLGSQFIGGSKPTVSISKDNRFLLGCAIGYGYNIGCQVVY